MQRRPLCSAAHTALLIDVDKGVRPCCAYSGRHLPGSLGMARLGDATLQEILAGPAWTAVRDALAAHEVPPGCKECIDREAISGWSQRLMMEQRRSPNWAAGITYLELSSSNLCNLQCRHCSPLFSSRWASHAKKRGDRHAHIVPPDGDLLLQNLRGVDLSHLEYVSIKGGEPMLNADVGVLFDHLEAIGVFAKVTIDMVTNGSQLDPVLVAKLARAREVRICLSIDGVGAVQTYIRHGPSAIERVEQAIAVYAAMPNVRLTRNTSVMVYNIFQLDRIDAWWVGLRERFPGHYTEPHYGLFVLSPAELALDCLQDQTRRRLADHYHALDAKLYAPVVRMLERPFAGPVQHNAFVRRTLQIDRELGRSVHDAVPELAAEMVLLPEPERPAASPPPATIVPPQPPLDPVLEAFRATVDQGWQALQRGDLTAAAQQVAQAKCAAPATVTPIARAALLHLASALTALQGDLQAALATIASACDLLPGHPGLCLHRARVLIALGRSGEARVDLLLAKGDPATATEVEQLLAGDGR